MDVTELPCVQWRRGESSIRVDGEATQLNTGPYSRNVDVQAPLASAASIDELEQGGFDGDIVVLHSDLVAEQLAPKDYPFYNPDGHRRIVSAVEAATPAAVIAATGMNPATSGGQYPFPLFEDGNFHIPNAYMRIEDAAPLLSRVGTQAHLVIDSGIMETTAPQAIARKGSSASRLVYFAHIDSKDGTPGALDNASGVAVLLELCHKLARYKGPHTLEIVPLNGEDYYAATGQLHWLALNEGRMGEIVQGFNVDGAGFRDQPTAVSTYGVEEQRWRLIADAILRHDFVDGPQWPQGDHSLFVFNNVPALAVTSANAFFVASTVAHTERDVVELVDPATIEAVADFLVDITERL